DLMEQTHGAMIMKNLAKSDVRPRTVIVTSRPSPDGDLQRYKSKHPFPTIGNGRLFLLAPTALWCLNYLAAAAAFAWSARNCSKPISVNGCFSNARIADKGPVITSAPILAHSMMWVTWRTDAANICVSKP